MIDHVMRNWLFSDKRYGFLPGRSTIPQLIKVIDISTENLDKNKRIDAAFHDMMKAFDKVPQKHLI